MCSGSRSRVLYTCCVVSPCPHSSASVSAHSASSSQTQDHPISAHPISPSIPIPTPKPTGSLLEPIPGQVGAHVNKQVMTTLLTGVEFSTVKRAVKAMETVEGGIRGSCKGFVRLLVRVPVRAQVGCSCNPHAHPLRKEIPTYTRGIITELIHGTRWRRIGVIFMGRWRRRTRLHLPKKTRLLY